MKKKSSKASLNPPKQQSNIAIFSVDVELIKNMVCILRRCKEKDVAKTERR
jgi:hypothetical protein